MHSVKSTVTLTVDLMFWIMENELGTIFTYEHLLAVTIIGKSGNVFTYRVSYPYLEKRKIEGPMIFEIVPI